MSHFKILPEVGRINSWAGTVLDPWIQSVLFNPFSRLRNRSSERLNKQAKDRALAECLSEALSSLPAELATSRKHLGASPTAQQAKNLSVKQKTQGQYLGQEYPMEEGVSTHSSILAWGIPWTEEPGGLQSIGLQRVRHDWSDWACTHAPEGIGCGSLGRWADIVLRRSRREICIRFALSLGTLHQASWGNFA